MGSRFSLVFCLLAGLILAGIGAPPASAQVEPEELNFVRGDANVDGRYDVSDGVRVLVYLFLGAAPLPCEDAGDVNDSGGLNVNDAVYTFNFLFVNGPAPTGPYSRCGKDPTADALGCEAYDACPQGPVDPSELQDIGHVLNRIAYGPSPYDVQWIQDVGLTAYMEAQLDPTSTDDDENVELATREEALFVERVPSRDVFMISEGDFFYYRKGTSQPDANWKSLAYVVNAPEWQLGATGIGYGDGDDATVLNDMRRLDDNPETPGVDESQPGYVTVFLRKVFTVADVSTIGNLVFRVDFDDGFVAYLNGTEIARRNVSGSSPAYNVTASSGHEAGSAEDIDITARKNLLVTGDNVLAIQVHNTSYTSSDLTMIPELINREILPGPPIRTIAGVNELQQLVHVRGVYSRRQLQAVLAEFWENHFTTDADKVAEYFDALLNSDATDAMSEAQARAEAAQVEYDEYQFFYDNALGNFGDMLLYSAASPAMLIYLDNVLNFKAEPNENYSREILELYAAGVDNRYTQRDIEELARCFTGWFVCKVAPENAQSFPASARTPPNECGVQFEDTQFIGLGAGWKYFKGTTEPSPGAGGVATTAWTEPGFNDAGWLNGSTGIGYGDGDDATQLNDMSGNYRSVYLRREFTVDDPFAFRNLILEIAYDDGYVAYLNGQEIGRSETMEDAASPPPFDENDVDSHEQDEGRDYHNLNRFLGLLNPAPQTNVLAIQVHNTNLGSSDLSMRPILFDREILPGSVENGDPNGVWAFRFDSNEHDTGAKTLFQGTPQQLNIPAGRVGAAGVLDALNVVDALVNHPSTKEFICIKLIQKFVSDEITLATFKDQTAPVELRALLADCIDAWTNTNGNIEAVMRVILDPQDRQSLFWDVDMAYRNKLKTPTEFINSSLRALDADASGQGLPGIADDMGMHLFTRDEPDGWSELGFDWMDTGRMLARIEFARELAQNTEGDYRWDTLTYVDGRSLDTPEEIVNYFSDLLFEGVVPQSNKDLLVEFLTTNDAGAPLAFSRARTDFRARVEELISVMLSMPQWHFQ